MSSSKTVLWCLHGFLGQPDDWDTLSSSRFSSDWRKLDLAEFAKQSLNLSEVASKLNEQVAKEEGRHILIGYSMGGRLALQALAEDSSLWSGAIFFSTHPGLTTQEAREERCQADELWAQEFQSGEWIKIMEKWNSQAVFGVQPAPSRAECLRAPLVHALRHWTLGRQTDHRKLLASLSTPFLWLTGAQDTKFLQFHEEIQRLCPNQHFAVIPETGHRLIFENPKAVIEVLDLFLERVYK